MSIRPIRTARARMGLRFAAWAIAAMLISLPVMVDAQGLVKGVQEGAAAGNKAAGPVGGVLGGAIGGVVGVFTGVLGVGNSTAAGGTSAGNKGAKDAKEAKQGDSSPKATKLTKGGKSAKSQPVVLTQPGAPQLTAEQIVANNDALIDRIRSELNLTPDQEKNWSGFSSAMHYLGHNGAERLNLRVARAQRDPPDDIIEQMRNEAQFLVDRAADQRNVADAAEPLYATLDDKQKQIFIQEMVRLSHERGLD